MMKSTIWIGCLVMAVLIVWVIYYYRKRRQMLAGLALRLQMRFSSGDTLDLLARLADCYLMQFGHSRRILNMLTSRREERTVFAFDYRYETGSGQDRTLHHYSVIAWQQKVSLPSVIALADQPFLPLGKFRSFSPMPTGDTKFDEAFTLYTDNAPAVQKLLTRDIQKILLDCGLINWQWQDQWTIFYTQSVLSALQIARLIHRGSHCCRLIADAKNIDAPVPPESTQSN